MAQLPSSLSAAQMIKQIQDAVNQTSPLGGSVSSTSTGKWSASTLWGDTYNNPIDQYNAILQQHVAGLTKQLQALEEERDQFKRDHTEYVMLIEYLRIIHPDLVDEYRCWRKAKKVLELDDDDAGAT